MWRLIGVTTLGCDCCTLLYWVSIVSIATISNDFVSWLTFSTLAQCSHFLITLFFMAEQQQKGVKSLESGVRPHIHEHTGRFLCGQDHSERRL